MPAEKPCVEACIAGAALSSLCPVSLLLLGTHETTVRVLGFLYPSPQFRPLPIIRQHQLKKKMIFSDTPGITLTVRCRDCRLGPGWRLVAAGREEGVGRGDRGASPPRPIHGKVCPSHHLLSTEWQALINISRQYSWLLPSAITIPIYCLRALRLREVNLKVTQLVNGGFQH